MNYAYMVLLFGLTIFVCAVALDVYNKKVLLPRFKKEMAEAQAEADKEALSAGLPETELSK
ncbi:MAG: hypothetical protein LBQ79_01570 [Deltaproteobacteria bacterium]|jgi:hypothetical protein|nr:hypothetical protein [Deltaproteobacteria bacterium]